MSSKPGSDLSRIASCWSWTVDGAKGTLRLLQSSSQSSRWSTGVHWRVNAKHSSLHWAEKGLRVFCPGVSLVPFQTDVWCLKAKGGLDMECFRTWPCQGIRSCKILDVLKSLMSVKAKILQAHSKISSLIRVAVLSGKLPLREPRRRATIFSRHLLYSETLILYFSMHLVWSSGQEASDLKEPEHKLPQCLFSQPGWFAKHSFLSQAAQKYGFSDSSFTGSVPDL